MMLVDEYITKELLCDREVVPSLEEDFRSWFVDDLDDNIKRDMLSGNFPIILLGRTKTLVETYNVKCLECKHSDAMHIQDRRYICNSCYASFEASDDALMVEMLRDKLRLEFKHFWWGEGEIKLFYADEEITSVRFPLEGRE